MMRADGARGRRAWQLLFAVALLVGAFLRIWQLGTQVLIDDEWHAINKLLHAGYADIATHFGFADYSIPLTLYYRFLFDHGGLSEWGMRLPMLLAGIGLLCVAPWLARRVIAPSTSAIWVGLMAISPIMVYHTRTARPYAITTLLCVVAILAFRQWWHGAERRWRWAALYVAVTFLTGWLHVITLAFALAPFGFFGLLALGDVFSAARRAQGLRRLRDLVVLGALTALPLAAALLPPLLTDWVSLAAKAGNDSVTLHSGYRTLLILFGIANPWLLVAGLCLCALGIASAWRREREFVAYVAFVVLVAIAAIAGSHATWLQHPLNFGRYIQPAVPFLLLALAEGLVVLLGFLRIGALQAGAAGAVLAGAWYAGPMPAYLYDPNQFMGDPYFQFDYDPAHNPYLTILPHGPIPEFYRRLGERAPRSVTLIETPWSLETDSDPQPLYQAVHRQYIKVALTTPVCCTLDYGNYPQSASGMRLTQFVHLSGLLQGDSYGADYLVVHERAWPKPEKPPPQWPDMASCLPKIEAHFGAPVYRDEDIEVFALSSVAKAESTGKQADQGESTR
jgi:hypothetical protein